MAGKLRLNGEILVDGFNAKGFYAVGTEGLNDGLSIVEVEGVPFTKTAEADCLPSKTAIPDKIEMRTSKNLLPAKKGDVVFLTFSARCVESEDESGEGKVSAYLHLNRNPYTGLLSDNAVCFGKEWKTFYLSEFAKNDLEKGDLNVVFHLGHQKQKIQIGGLYPLSLGQNFDIAKFPKPDQLITSNKGKKK